MKWSFLIKKILNKLSMNNKQNQNSTYQKTEENFSTNIDENQRLLKNILGNSQDVTYTRFKIQGYHDETDALLVAIDGLVDDAAKRNNIIKPLIEPLSIDQSSNQFETIKSRLSVKQVTEVNDLHKGTQNVLKSRVLLLVDGCSQGLVLPVEGFETRAITEPETEKTVRGPKEGFTEEVNINLSLLRRKIQHPSLRFDTIEIGEYSQTDIVIGYVKDIADPHLIARVKNRFHQISMDMVDNSGQIEQLIEDHPYTIFPTIGNTERPDRAATLLMEGRVLILVNGDPVSLFVPYQFVESIKNIEDYSSRPFYASFVRLIRFFAFGLSITLPALYISSVNFNKSLIPSDLIVPLTIARESVPFPLALEVIIMMLLFEMVREAGIRLPNQIGTAITIVGPLIIGEVAVASSFVGAPTVIIVSISFIASFVITPIYEVTALLRIGLFIASSIFGSYGIVVGLLALITHMISLTSLGVPYMAPFAPFYLHDWNDTFVRFPTRLLKTRTKSVPNQRPEKVKSVPDTGGKQ